MKNALTAIAARDRENDAEREEDCLTPEQKENCLTPEQEEAGCLPYEQKTEDCSTSEQEEAGCLPYEQEENCLTPEQKENCLTPEQEEAGCLPYEQKTEGCSTSEQEEVADTYLTAWKIGTYDSGQLAELLERSFFHTDMNAEEQLLPEQYRSEPEADTKNRTGDSSGAFQQVNRTKRLYILCKMGAPAAIICKEECLLAAAMAVHAFGKSVG